MSEVTQLIYAYREGVRTLWNGTFRPGVKPYVDFDAIDIFAEIRGRLFQELVLRPIGMQDYRKASVRDPYPFLRLAPKSDPVPIMINRPSQDGNMYWDDPVGRLGANGLCLLFVDFFDWDDFGFIDLQYYRARIATCPEHPQVEGREGLLDVHHAGVEFTSPGPPGRATR